jgi:hypothetical protein
MIPINALRAVRRIFVHRQSADTACADGRASAILLNAAIPEAEIVEVTYEHLPRLKPERGTLFCDLTPWAPKPKGATPTPDEKQARIDAMAPWIDAGTIVLDHHKTVADLVPLFGYLGVFGDERRDPGVSGAVLALREVLEPIKGPEPPFIGDARWRDAEALARLAGVRDTWQRLSPEWTRACELAAVLCALPLDSCLRRGPRGILEATRDIGPDLVAMRQALVRDAAKNAVRTHIGGRRVAILSREDLISDVAEVLRDEVDIVIGFAYVQSGDRVSLKWSLRSRGDVDVAAIAERHGGGGHTAAAGFHEVIIGDGHMAHMANPYARAEVLFA